MLLVSSACHLGDTWVVRKPSGGEGSRTDPVRSRDVSGILFRTLTHGKEGGICIFYSFIL